MKRRGIAVLGASLCLCSTLLSPTAALADAHGVEPIFWKTVDVSVGPVSSPIPTGYLAHSIQGSGLKVDRQAANFSPALGIGIIDSRRCDWQIRFAGFDVRGKATSVFRGPLNPGCARFGRHEISNRTYREGTTTICAVLVSQGKELARQCHRT